MKQLTMPTTDYRPLITATDYNDSRTDHSLHWFTNRPLITDRWLRPLITATDYTDSRTDHWLQWFTNRPL